MTREEKISHLKGILSEINESEDAVCYLTSEDNELIESAIEALSQESCYNPDEWCHTCSEYDQDKHCCHRWSKVIRNAVEEMKQSCEDAVSREDAIGAVANLFEMSEYPHPYPQGKPIRLREIKEKLKQLPPVQPKIKTGQWFLLDECSNSGYYCSECHKKLVKEGWSGTVKKIKFCPNCGCRMVKPQESEDAE